ncbi:MAG TPA: hypothetical protein VFJ97_12515 [Dermatophilaceae bacterium]|nr:hypothetical protein [Dermatophilaceae bacterium]
MTRDVRVGRVTRHAVAGIGLGACVVLAIGVVLGGWALLANRPPDARAWFAVTAAVAVVVPFARPKVERVAERMAFGADGDPHAVLSRFIDDVSGAIALDDVLPQLARAAAAATHSPTGQATLRLADGAAFRRTWPPDASGVPDQVTVALEHGGRPVGELGVQAADARAADGDRSLLRQLSGPAGLALANVGLTYDLRRQLAQEKVLVTELEASRHRLLAAASEQRTRFAADVARTVDPRLAEASAALRVLMDGDTDALHTAKRAAQDALDALRALAAGVFPIVLAERGLVAALDQYLQGRDHLRWRHQPPVLPRLRREVEAAAYSAVVSLFEDKSGPAGSAGWVDLLIPAGGPLRVEVGRASPPTNASVQLVRDRVEAVEGRVETQATSVVLVLPADTGQHADLAVGR